MKALKTIAKERLSRKCLLWAEGRTDFAVRGAQWLIAGRMPPRGNRQRLVELRPGTAICSCKFLSGRVSSPAMRFLRTIEKETKSPTEVLPASFAAYLAISRCSSSTAPAWPSGPGVNRCAMLQNIVTFSCNLFYSYTRRCHI